MTDFSDAVFTKALTDATQDIAELRAKLAAETKRADTLALALENPAKRLLDTSKERDKAVIEACTQRARAEAAEQKLKEAERAIVDVIRERDTAAAKAVESATRVEALSEKLKAKEAELERAFNMLRNTQRATDAEIDRLRQLHESVEGPTQTALRDAGAQVTELKNDIDVMLREEKIFAKKGQAREDALAARVVELEGKLDDICNDNCTCKTRGGHNPNNVDCVISLCREALAPTSPAVVEMARAAIAHADAEVAQIIAQIKGDHVSQDATENTCHETRKDYLTAKKAAGRG